MHDRFLYSAIDRYNQNLYTIFKLSAPKEEKPMSMMLYSAIDYLLTVSSFTLEVLGYCYQANLDPLLKPKEYRGYNVTQFHSEVKKFILEKTGSINTSIEIELVTMEESQATETHYHTGTDVVAAVLGEPMFRDPKNAWLQLDLDKTLLEKKFTRDYITWCPIRPNRKILIPKSTIHAMAVEAKGNLTFLSIQSKPIQNIAGDDYFVIK